MLRIYVSAHCIGCATARRLAEHVQAQCPHLALTVIDLDASSIKRPAYVIGTPFYTWHDRVLFMGNPSAEELVKRVDELYESEHCS